MEETEHTSDMMKDMMKDMSYSAGMMIVLGCL